MPFRTKQKHIIDLLFPVALFFVFALCAITVILLAARIYQSTTESSALTYTSRTSLSYLTEKIHQNDCEGAVYLDELDGCQALVMAQSHDKERYYTYIYVYGRELKELFVKEGVEVTASAGRTIMEVQDFSMEQLSEDLLKFSCVDRKNQEASAIVSIKSK